MWFPRARPALCGHGLRGGCGVGTPLLVTLRSKQMRHFCMLALGTWKCQGLLRSFRSSGACCGARRSVPVPVAPTTVRLSVGVRLTLPCHGPCDCGSVALFPYARLSCAASVPLGVRVER